jgi:hypothetical protein
MLQFPFIFFFNRKWFSHFHYCRLLFLFGDIACFLDELPVASSFPVIGIFLFPAFFDEPAALAEFIF